MEFAGGGDAGLSVLLLDRSASMARQRDGKRLIDLAIQELPEVVARIPEERIPEFVEVVPVRDGKYAARISFGRQDKARITSTYCERD